MFCAIAWFISLTVCLYSGAKEIADIEVLSSESSSERSEVVSSSEEEDGGVKWG